MPWQDSRYWRFRGCEACEAAVCEEEPDLETYLLDPTGPTKQLQQAKLPSSGIATATSCEPPPGAPTVNEMVHTAAPPPSLPHW